MQLTGELKEKVEKAETKEEAKKTIGDVDACHHEQFME